MRWAMKLKVWFESNDLPLDTACNGPLKSTYVSPWVKLIFAPIAAGGLADLKERLQRLF